ncbi:MAG: hypothetical protein ABI443_06265, partial [Chthoniobacterales bacterium]
MLRIVALSLLGLFSAVLPALAGSMGYPGGSTGTAGKLTFDEPTLFNTTLIGEKVLAKEVVCRTMWGTPMLPNTKAGYSIIAPIKPALIAESNIIPPL